jgi:hypothetical protein
MDFALKPAAKRCRKPQAKSTSIYSKIFLRANLFTSFSKDAVGRPYAAPNVGYWANSGQSWILASSGHDANDPKRTSGVHCGNGFDAVFNPYQSTRQTRVRPVFQTTVISTFAFSCAIASER